ncbi:zinc-ribbon domain-containing protein [bacterium]|nr:zinc-ribbon domain-containing protein [bacterium]
MSISKPLTFECGRCGSMYGISHEDLGQAGAKITCPKCYAFFYLKPSRDDIKPPIIEKIASRDGEYQGSSPPPIPGEKTTEKILSEAIEALSYPAIKDEQAVYPVSNDSAEHKKIEDSSNEPDSDDPTNSLIQHHIPNSEDALEPLATADAESNNLVEELWHKDSMIEQEIHKLPDSPNTAEQSALNFGLEEVTGNFYDPETVITQDSLADYPEDPPETSVDKSIVWLASIFLAVCALLFAHYNRSLTLPFLKGFQKPLAVEQPEKSEQITEIPSSQNAKYGFPEVEDLNDEEVLNDDEVDINKVIEQEKNANKTPEQQ